MDLRVLVLFYLCLVGAALTEDVSVKFLSKTNGQLDNDAEVEVGHSTSLLLSASADVDGFPFAIKYEANSDKNQNTTDKISVDVGVPVYNDNKTQWTLTVRGEQAGHVTLVVVYNSSADNSTDYGQPLDVVSEVIGWIYFVAWSISFYPQVYLNWKRKSVVGLNFDFVGFNEAGFLCYSAYNVALFWIGPVQAEFKDQNPHDIIPVEVNDVVFALHAVTLTTITLIQILIYDRGDQTVSITARVILSGCTLAIAIVLIIAAVPTVPQFSWLEMVMSLSYIKLGITIIKYIPQAYMNFRRKSTVGWSIGNILLDFTGGSGSIIQMFILAYNFNDWNSIFLNPVKFWLGAISIVFDILFIVQHYCLYRHSPDGYTIQRNAQE